MEISPIHLENEIMAKKYTKVDGYIVKQGYYSQYTPDSQYTTKKRKPKERKLLEIDKKSTFKRFGKE